MCSNMIRALPATVVGQVKWTAQPGVDYGLVGRPGFSPINDGSGVC